MPPFLDLLRLFLGASVLAFASYTDWRWRRAPNVLWLILAVGGLLILVAESVLDPAAWSAKWPYLLAIPPVLFLISRTTIGDVSSALSALAGVVAVVWAARAGVPLTANWVYLVLIPVFSAIWYFVAVLPYTRLGGADMQALISLSVLVPFPPLLAPGLPPLSALAPAAVVAFSNGLIVAALFPLSVLIYNIVRRDFGLLMFLGAVKLRADRFDETIFWPHLFIDDQGERNTRLFLARISSREMDENIARIRTLGAERIWVTPRLPFLIPIAIGYALAFFVGDLMLALLTRVVA